MQKATSPEEGNEATRQPGNEAVMGVQGWPVRAERLAQGLWWDRAWSLVDGCTAVSAGCEKCWARRMHERFHPDEPWERVGARPDRLGLPLRVRKPAVWAVWNDLFHPKVSQGFIRKACGRMKWARACGLHHVFVVLTKRAERMQSYLTRWEPLALANVMVGVSVEDQATADERLPPLMGLADFGWRTMISYEPGLGPVEWDWSKGKPEWLAAGCESGSAARPCDHEWIRRTVELCRAGGVRLFVKQLSTRHAYSGYMAEWPKDLRVRELPG